MTYLDGEKHGGETSCSHTPRKASDAAYAHAACVLEGGGAVIFPTDTVYGVGVSVRHAPSPNLLYELKQREQRKPVAWLVSSHDDLTFYGSDVPAFAQALARTFWPGPLTLIVRASEAVPQAFRSQENTIGLRMPENETALGLIRAVASPLATTSANMAGARPPRTYEEIDPAFAQRVSCTLADDTPKSGVASTILDCTGDHPVLVREGAITIADIRALS